MQRGEPRGRARRACHSLPQARGSGALRKRPREEAVRTEGLRDGDGPGDSGGCRRGLGRARGPCSAALQPGFGVPGRSPTATTVTSSRATARRLGPRRGGRRERQPYPPRGHAGDGTEPRGPGDGGSAPRVRGEQDLRGGGGGTPVGQLRRELGGQHVLSRAVRGGRTVVRQEHVCGHGRLPGGDAVESVCRRAAGLRVGPGRAAPPRLASAGGRTPAGGTARPAGRGPDSPREAFDRGERGAPHRG